MGKLGGFHWPKVQPALLERHSTKHFMPIISKIDDTLVLSLLCQDLAQRPKSHSLPFSLALLLRSRQTLTANTFRSDVRPLTGTLQPSFWLPLRTPDLCCKLRFCVLNYA